MNPRINQPHRLPRLTILLLGAVMVLGACADKSAIREKDIERYDTLESELIDAQQAEERRLRSEMRVAQKLAQMEAERATALAARQKAQTQAATAIASSQGDLQTIATPPSPSTTIVTQVVVGQSSPDGEPSVWTLAEHPSPIDGSAMCAVLSESVTVRNGTIDTRVRVIITTDTVFLRTDATFDTTVPEFGFSVDAGFPIAFDRFLNEVTAVVDDSYDRLIGALESGSTLTISFAYSPQLSSAETHRVELNLETLGQPLSELPDCLSGEVSGETNAGPADS